MQHCLRKGYSIYPEELWMVLKVALDTILTEGELLLIILALKYFFSIVEILIIKAGG